MCIAVDLRKITFEHAVEARIRARYRAFKSYILQYI